MVKPKKEKLEGRDEKIAFGDNFERLCSLKNIAEHKPICFPQINEGKNNRFSAPSKRYAFLRGKKIGIVVSRFNDFITQRLLAGCLEELACDGIQKSNIAIIWVPGAYEIPLAASKLAKKKTIHVVICLGAVIRGETLHYDLVAKAAAYGIMQVSLMTGKPIIFGVLATDTVEQANKRSQDKGDNKGRDAAVTALETMNVVKQIARVK